MYKDVTGIILSGGKSLRMGTNKSFLDISGQTAIERTANLMKTLFHRVLLITNEPDLYQIPDVTVYQDIYKNMGPLAGIHSGLLNSNTDRNFIISCDMPLITSEIIRFISDYKSSKPIVIAKADGYNQQLCGIYSKTCLPYIDKILNKQDCEEPRTTGEKKRRCKLMTLVHTMEGTIIDIEKEYKLYKPNSFLNMNKPEEYELILELVKFS